MSAQLDVENDDPVDPNPPRENVLDGRLERPEELLDVEVAERELELLPEPEKNERELLPLLRLLDA